MSKSTYAAVFMAIALVPSVAAAQSSVKTSAEQPVPLSDTELDAQRGGFETPNGVEFSFGAEVDTYVDGKLALRSQLTWTPQGVVETTTGGHITSDLAAKAAAAGIQLGSGATGAYIPGANGGTVVLNNASQNQISNAVLNTADNRNISQNTTINLAIPDLQQYQSMSNAAQMALKLQDSVTQASGVASR